MILRRGHLAALLVAVSIAANARPSYAQWQLNGVPLCTAVRDQTIPQVASDMAGGAIVTWEDRRSSDNNPHIYAQHLLASGMVDPRWTAANNGDANGTPISTATPGIQTSPTIVSDGAHGAIIAWEYGRTTSSDDICAQHVLASGVVDGSWPANGTSLCTATKPQSAPSIVSDGAQGAIVTWSDGQSGNDICAQRVLASGVVDGSWPANGTRLCVGTGASNAGVPFLPKIASDMAGGAIVTWEDARDPSTHIYARRVSADGQAQWATNGVALCTALANEVAPQIVSDLAGGAIVTWQDSRPPKDAFYAQHVLASGVVDGSWLADGTRLSTASIELASGHTIVSDMAGGAIVTFLDSGNGIYAQRVLSTGAVQWGTGTGVCPPAKSYEGGTPQIVTDGASGAIVTWVGFGSIFAGRVLASGVLDPAWATSGAVLTTPPFGHIDMHPAIATDGAQGAIVTWQDYRSGIADIYAQEAYANGVPPTAVAPGVPALFAVHTPHPNPAHAAAAISFDLPTAQRVSVGVYDVAGHLVRTLAAVGELPAGTHSLVWNGISNTGAPASAGIYFIRVSAGSRLETRRVAMIR